MRELVSYTDYLVICTARNERQAKAIHDEVYHQLKREGWLPARVEGVREAEWVLMDYLDACCTCSRRSCASGTGSRCSGARPTGWSSIWPAPAAPPSGDQAALHRSVGEADAT